MHIYADYFEISYVLKLNYYSMATTHCRLEEMCYIQQVHSVHGKTHIDGAYIREKKFTCNGNHSWRMNITASNLYLYWINMVEYGITMAIGYEPCRLW